MVRDAAHPGHGVVRMTLVRRHLVAAVSLVLALATGIALGAGPLSRETLVPTQAEPRRSAPPAEQSADDLAEALAPDRGARPAHRTRRHRPQHARRPGDDVAALVDRRRAGRAATCSRSGRSASRWSGRARRRWSTPSASSSSSSSATRWPTRRRRRTNGWGSCSARPSPPATSGRRSSSGTRPRSGRASTPPPSCSSRGRGAAQRAAGARRARRRRRGRGRRGPHHRTRLRARDGSSSRPTSAPATWPPSTRLGW